MLLWLVAMCLWPCAAQAGSRIVVPLHSELCVTSADAVAAAVAEPSMPPPPPCVGNEVTGEWTWFALRTPPTLRELPSDWQLLVDQVRFTGIRIVVTHDQGVETIARRSGDLAAHRSYGNNLHFHLGTPGQRVTGLYIGFENIDDPGQFRSARAMSARAYGEFRMKWYALAALFVGAVGSSLIYNLFLSTWLMTPLQRWYLLWGATAFAYTGFWSGAALELTPWLTGPAVVRLNLLLIGALVFTGLKFFVALVGRDILPRTLTRTADGVAIAALVAAVAAAADAVVPAVIGDLFLNFTFVASVGVIAVGAASALRSGSRAIWFYIVAWTPVMGVFALRIARNFGLFPQSDIIDMAGFAAIALESVVLSLAIADRFRELRRANDAAQAERLTLERVATTDALTGVGNRAAFQEQLGRMKESDDDAALVLVDVDHLKEVNDRIGHDAGDELIRHVADRLRCFAGEHEFVARIGGDEFALLIMRDATERLADLEQSVGQANLTVVPMAGGDVGISLSVGVAPWAGAGGDIGRLYKQADLALYAAKRDGRGCCRRYDDTMSSNREAARTQVAAARSALANGDFLLHFQPIVDMRSGHTVAREALLRWQLADGRLVGPGDFEAVFEDRLFLTQLQDWVLSAALEHIRSDLDSGAPGLPTGVNFVASQLQGEASAQHILRKLHEQRIPPSLLSVEVTETVILGRAGGPVVHCLGRLRAAGVSIALDDFGTGYASLLHLRDLPADALKIDRSFVKGLPHEEGSKKIVRAIVALAHSLGKHVVAEGIETEEQHAYLRKLGCDFGQGYLVGRPSVVASAMLVNSHAA